MTSKSNASYLPRFLAALFLGVCLSLMTAASAETPEEAPVKLFTVITSEKAETQFMALVLSLQSARKGAEVRILLCDEAGKLAIRGGSADSLLPANRSPRDLLADLIGLGVRVEICAIFLPNRDYTMEDLLPEVAVARPDQVADYMLQPGVRFFTF